MMLTSGNGRAGKCPVCKIVLNDDSWLLSVLLHIFSVNVDNL